MATAINPFLSDSEGDDSTSGSQPRPQQQPHFPEQPQQHPQRCLQADGERSGTDRRMGMDAIASYLLEEQLLLTALELHTELLEGGRDLPRLRDFFSNPANFERPAGTRDTGTSGPSPLNRVGSVSTLDSLDFTRYSDDGTREMEERVADLEIPPMESKNYKQEAKTQDPIRPLEKRALNFLVNEYLLQNKYKLASITFSDENDEQDFEDWDDVGLNLPKPPALLQLYRDQASRHAMACRETSDAATSTEGDSTAIISLTAEFQQRIATLNVENLTMTARIKQLEKEIEVLHVSSFSPKTQSPCRAPSDTDREHKDVILQPDNGTVGEHEVVQSTGEDGGDRGFRVRLADLRTWSSTEPALRECAPIIPNAEPDGKKIVEGQGSNDTSFKQTCRSLPSTFLRALLSVYQTAPDTRLGSEVSCLPDSDGGAVLMLSRCLPHIVPNVLLAKREELIPLILCTACLHPNPKERDHLLHSLFNLIKRPDNQQRQMILTGCVAFARHAGPTRVDAELLPQCWEQISHKYPERRLLVAEACGALAPYLPPEMRSSLVLSMLQQMLMEDKSDTVREAVIKSLGVLMGCVDDPNKYSQGFELLTIALCDPSAKVIAATHQVFLPAFAYWAAELGRLQSHLVHTLISRIETLVREAEYGLDETQLHAHLSALQSLITALYSHVLLNSPFALDVQPSSPVPAVEVTRFPRPVSALQDVAVLVGGREKLAWLLHAFEVQLHHEGTGGWPSLLWIVNQLSRVALPGDCLTAPASDHPV
uniref:RAB11 binding and LisH domain, coiled-coil and HEAT repeat containing n=1 Tax=Eptatretus burgeri TaxID=7764 RepID=A0A8C4PZK3_EPTBU